MINKQNSKDEALKNKKKFLKDVKNGKYGKPAKVKIEYSRMNERSQPFQNLQQQKTVLFYGIN